GLPIRPQAFVVRHRVLDDQSLDPVRMCQGHAKTHWAAVILHVKRVAREAQRFGEVIYDLSAVIERVRKFFRVRPVAMSEARVVGRDKMITIGKPGEERLEHPRGGGDSVQQEKRRGGFRTGPSLKGEVTVYPVPAIKNRVFHGSSFASSKMTSNSIGVPSGRLATPYTRRQGLLSFPKMSCSNSEAASATLG